MVKKSLLLIALLGVAFNFKMSFSEYNIMYHFDDLFKQFSYIKSDYLTYKERLKNTINTINGIKSDLMFFVEYDNNRNSGAYLNTQKVLKEQLTISLESYKNNKDLASYLKENDNVPEDCKVLIQIFAPEGFTVPYENEEGFNTIIESLSECKDLLNGKSSQVTDEEKLKAKEEKRTIPALELASIGEHLWKKFYTLQHSKGLFLNGEGAEKYRLVGFDKKCGTVLKGKEVLKGYAFKWSDCKFDNINAPYSNRQQSNLVIYNTEKLELISKDIAIGKESPTTMKIGDKAKPDDQIYPKVFAVMDKNEPLSQNFGVYLFKYKEKGFENSQDQRGLIFIGAHFKSKKDGFDGRQKMGEAITEVVSNLKAVLPTWDVILSGDLNAEIGEIAKNLNEPIFRLEDQMAKNFGYKIQNIFTPQDFSMDSIGQQAEALRVVKQFKEFENDICKNLNVFQRMKIQGFSLDSKDKSSVYVKSDTKLEDPYLNNEFYFNKEQNFNNFWIELNNFPTELKVRVKELDYTEEGFDKCILTEAFTKSVVGNESILKAILTFRSSSMAKKISDLVTEDNNNIYPLLENVNNSKDLFKVFLKIREKWMASRKDAVYKYLQAKIEFLEWTASADTERDCFARLFEREKIDFVLLKPYNNVNVEIIKMKTLSDHLKVGFPNKDFASDHVPTKLNLTFDLEEEFNLETSVFAGAAFTPKKLI